MSDQTLSWFSLAALPLAERQGKVDDRMLACRLKELTEAVRQAVQEGRELLYLRGLLATDAYHEAAKENLYTSDETAIAPRVRWDKKSGFPTFYWERVVKRMYPLSASGPVSAGKGRGKSYKATILVGKGDRARKVSRKVVLLSEHVRLCGRTDSIPPATFNGEPLWSRTLGPLAEEKLTILRKQSKVLSQINRCLIRLQELELELEGEK